jgi:hypothetical protein
LNTLNWIFGNFKGFTWQRDIQFMVAALEFFLMVVSVAAHAVTIA